MNHRQSKCGRLRGRIWPCLSFSEGREKQGARRGDGVQWVSLCLIIIWPNWAVSRQVHDKNCGALAPRPLQRLLLPYSHFPLSASWSSSSYPWQKSVCMRSLHSRASMSAWRHTRQQCPLAIRCLFKGHTVWNNGWQIKGPQGVEPVLVNGTESHARPDVNMSRPPHPSINSNALKYLHTSVCSLTKDMNSL